MAGYFAKSAVVVVNVKNCDNGQCDTTHTTTRTATAAAPVAAAASGFVSDYDDTVTINLDTEVDLDSDAYAIETLEGIGPQTGNLFRGYGVPTVGDYLRKLHKPMQREEAARELNILVKPLHDWASMADLLRVAGIDHQYAELTYATGVQTVGELGRGDASHLQNEMERVNSAGKQLIAPTVPSVGEVSDWDRPCEKHEPCCFCLITF